ncbi:helix-turn-helix domain-containing protein [Bacillus tropicus]|uniref:helix-turn-helix domain-containing protein n=1 Tax=Bacillus tropicus TaxID=2026188 RepID=UPI000B44BA72|nr:helix-turn-helix transcriptional regulator [Bacillus tropicus]MBG9937449.1 XRE family transcriptional regulator [Bacillus tropicus]MED2996927.1 helix-turn-helix transcriptional regulator [Bacillus tropicus]OTY56780.1 transcriptional regulator [Bacillus thuringiensis serovar graciosensis]
MVIVKMKDPIKIRLAIAKTGRSLRGFAETIGMSHAYLSQILNGRHNPSPTIANKIASGLQVEIEDFFLIKVVDVTTRW